MARPRVATDGMALLGMLTLWHQHPAIVEQSPAGMPLTPVEIEAGAWLDRHAFAVLVSTPDGKAYLQPATE